MYGILLVMNNFKGGRGGFKKKGSKFEGKQKHGGGKKYGGDKKFEGGQQRTDRTTGPSAELFSATCSDCHAKCEVPFRPSHDKPVYCTTCFGVKKNANEPRGSKNDGDRQGKGSYSNQQHEHKNKSSEHHSSHRGSKSGRGDDSIADLKRQITVLDVKLNRILDLINPPMPSKKIPLPIKEKVVVKVASKKVKKTTVKVAAKKVAKKVVAKKVTKKVAKKVVTKTTPKKVAKKTTVKKVAKKVTSKKVVKKAKK